ncbi:class F sortase [Nonomuraea sp. NPDC046570]|uniref:class F sortase n=1 Tax=Nonomuraea sp. NPDC046570 TaxID=3155255 RepID=UPI0033EA532E
MAERRRALAAVLLLPVVALTGCKAVSGARAEYAVKPGVVVPAQVKDNGWPDPQSGEPGEADPLGVVIPRAGVNAPVVEIDGGAGGKLSAPPLSDANLAGWDRRGPTPGEPGAAVLVGHLDTRTGPAVFASLSKLKKGDTVAVVREDGRVVVFRTTAVQEVGKDAFPVRKVFGTTGGPAIRLVTCGGHYDPARHSYQDNLIVYGDYAAWYRLSDFTRTAPARRPAG